MKVIDLLNKIASGEKVPNYIKYYNCKTNKNEIMMVCELNIIYKLNHEEMFLNDEIDIIEEEEPIEKLDNNIYVIDSKFNARALVSINALNHKVNELVEKVNKLEREMF